MTNKPGLPFESGKLLDKFKLTKDGHTFKEQEDEILFGSYFFLNNKRVLHKRDVQTIFDVLSTFGGLASTVFNVFSIIGLYANSRFFMADLITKIFSVKQRSNLG